MFNFFQLFSPGPHSLFLSFPSVCHTLFLLFAVFLLWIATHDTKSKELHNTFMKKSWLILFNIFPPGK